jgi:hypothetical protein
VEDCAKHSFSNALSTVRSERERERERFQCPYIDLGGSLAVNFCYLDQRCLLLYLQGPFEFTRLITSFLQPIATTRGITCPTNTLVTSPNSASSMRQCSHAQVITRPPKLASSHYHGRIATIPYPQLEPIGQLNITSFLSSR